MLNKEKLFKALSQVQDKLFYNDTHANTYWQDVWEKLCQERDIVDRLRKKKYTMLLPYWTGFLADVCKVAAHNHPYAVVATDGSQIYYDRHQGPACYMLQTGTVLFEYGVHTSNVSLSSYPYVHVLDPSDDVSPGFVDLQREEYELVAAVQKTQEFLQKSSTVPLACMLDGSIIFWHMQGDMEQKQEYLSKYFDQFQQLYDMQVPWFGYISYPKSRELVNILTLYDANFDDQAVQRCALFDTDITSWYLQPGQQTRWFENKSGISYVYPDFAKPYFCYVHVGFEIVRLEAPAWVACNDQYAQRITQIAYDQAQKGKGYPVCLFEAHEQAVISSKDRDFFYSTLHIMAKQRKIAYKQSEKSRKKRQPLV